MTKSKALAPSSGAHLGAISVHRSMVVVQLDRDEQLQIDKAFWPSIASKNYVENGLEFHVRIRQHTKSGTLLVYASTVEGPGRPMKSAGRLVTDAADVDSSVIAIAKDLGIPLNLNAPFLTS